MITKTLEIIKQTQRGKSNINSKSISNKLNSNKMSTK